MKKFGYVMLGIAGLFYDACASFIADAHEVGKDLAATIKKSKAEEEKKSVQEKVG